MTEKKCNLFRYIASAVLILYVILLVIPRVIKSASYGFLPRGGLLTSDELLIILSNVILAVSLLTKKDKLFAVGIVIRLIFTVCFGSRLITTVVSTMSYALIVIFLLDVKKYNKLGGISAGILLATDVAEVVISSLGYLGFIDILYWLISQLILSLPIVFAVIAIQNSPQSKPLVIQKRTTPNITTGEKLTKLKELLDMGAITQEEFEAKKKQLLGL